jgi:hypothetical protein
MCVCVCVCVWRWMKLFNYYLYHVKYVGHAYILKGLHYRTTHLQPLIYIKYFLCCKDRAFWNEIV